MTAFYQWLWYLLPGNPMLVRIVEGGSNRVRHLFIRMGYLGALILLVLFGLLSGAGIQGEQSLAALAKVGFKLFAVISYGQVVLICLLAPLFMAGAIASEQSGKTFNILLTTPLTNLQIVLGSLFGRLFFVWALLASGLPLFAILLIFGGVPIRSVFISFATAAFSALFVGSVAVTLAVLRAGGRKAVFAFVIAIAAFLVVVYAADAFLLRGTTGGTTWLTPLHPLLVVEASFNSGTYRPPSSDQLLGLPWAVRFYLGRPFAAFASLSMIGSTVLVIASSIQVRRVGQVDSSSGVLAMVRRWLRLPLPGAERVRPAREVWNSPIAWREANTRGNGTSGILGRWIIVIIGMVVALLLLLLYHLGAMSFATFHIAISTLLLAELAVVALVAVYMSAGTVSREREDGTLDLLLTTPVTPKQYIWGKLRGLVSFLSLLMALPVATMIIISIYAGVGGLLGWPTATPSFNANGGTIKGTLMLPEAGPLLAVMFVPFVAFCVAVGMWTSLKARSVLGAVIPTIGIVGLLSLVLGFCGWVSAENIPFIGSAINALSPSTNVTMLLNPWARISGFSDSQLAGRITLMLGSGVAAGVYSLAVYGMILGMVDGFDHTVRRLSGTG